MYHYFTINQEKLASRILSIMQLWCMDALWVMIRLQELQWANNASNLAAGRPSEVTQCRSCSRSPKELTGNMESVVAQSWWLRFNHVMKMWHAWHCTNNSWKEAGAMPASMSASSCTRSTKSDGGIASGLNLTSLRSAPSKCLSNTSY